MADEALYSVLQVYGQTPGRGGNGAGWEVVQRGGRTGRWGCWDEFALRCSRRSALGIEDAERGVIAMEGDAGRGLVWR